MFLFCCAFFTLWEFVFTRLITVLLPSLWNKVFDFYKEKFVFFSSYLFSPLFYSYAQQWGKTPATTFLAKQLKICDHILPEHQVKCIHADERVHKHALELSPLLQIIKYCLLQESAELLRFTLSSLLDQAFVLAVREYFYQLRPWLQNEVNA